MVGYATIDPWDFPFTPTSPTARRNARTAISIRMRRARGPRRTTLRALIAEMRIGGAGAPFKGNSISTIFFGGGTPSLFQPASIGKILDAAQQTFGIERDAEITLEANPGTVDQEKLTRLSSGRRQSAELRRAIIQ